VLQNICCRLVARVCVPQTDCLIPGAACNDGVACEHHLVSNRTGCMCTCEGSASASHPAILERTRVEHQATDRSLVATEGVQELPCAHAPEKDLERVFAASTHNVPTRVYCYARKLHWLRGDKCAKVAIPAREQIEFAVCLNNHVSLPAETLAREPESTCKGNESHTRSAQQS
jgi:hypothetical protein